MKKLGLALSGGGFRASLYHLGLLRFLRDAGILTRVTHITSVSGGSIMAAHLALNWERYTDGAKEFDAAASEFLAFVRLDVRNRITRRFPLTLPLRWPRRLLGRSNRRLTRTGLLEYHYERFLYGDKSLFELPQKPQLHILATNLSEGCLCSFNRSGLLMVRRQPGGTVRVDRIHVGLATVAMAVTASSAFPAFFPPLELTGAEVGAGEFGRQAYTDGGVFDNLGVRMFHCLERPLLAESPLCRDDFVDFQASVKALWEASRSPEETPLRRLAQILVVACRQPNLLLLPGGGSRGANPPPAIEAGQPGRPASPGTWVGDNEEAVLAGLWNVMCHYQFRLDPLFADLQPLEPEAQALLRVSRLGGQPLGAGDQVWLNRHLIEAAFRQATGVACLRRLNSGLDGVLVSDVGKPIQVQNNRRAGGVIRTALRASDILMDRVWQLESEKFHDAPGFVFAPITEVVEPAEDPTALHPEVQRQVARMRTDLDRFSPLEISTLARHGYCVGRKACRAHPALFGADFPEAPPWDPLPAPGRTPTAVAALMHLDGSAKAPTPVTTDARALQASALRRIWSTLLDRRDWVSYVYVPIILPILFLLPYLAIDAYKRYHRLGQFVHAFAQGTRDLETLNQMLDTKVVAFAGAPVEKVLKFDEPDLKGFDILQDSRIFNLRDWKPSQSGNDGAEFMAHIYRRVKVLKRRENTTNNLFRLVLLPISPKAVTRFPPQQLAAKLRMGEVKTSALGREECRWEAIFDFAHVPPGEFADLVMEELSPGQYLDRNQSGSGLTFRTQAATAELTTWIIMPRGKEYQNFQTSRHQPGRPETAEKFRPVTEYLADDYSILAFKFVGLEPGWEFDISWTYR